MSARLCTVQQKPLVFEHLCMLLYRPTYNSVQIVGADESGAAVLTTSSESYKLTKVETSNTVLLLPDLCQAAAACTDCGSSKQLEPQRYCEYLSLTHCRLISISVSMALRVVKFDSYLR